MSYDAPQNHLTGTAMIMLLTYRAELQEQITKSLKAMGHDLCLPAHRTDVTAMKESPPDLVILDMYLDNPASSLVLQNTRRRVSRCSHFVVRPFTRGHPRRLALLRKTPGASASHADRWSLRAGRAKNGRRHLPDGRFARESGRLPWAG